MPPRASTKSDGKRARTRGGASGQASPAAARVRPGSLPTGGRADKAAERRSASVVPTDRYERIAEDDVLEVTELPEAAPARLSLLVLEAAPHLAAAQGAIAAAGHAVAGAASGPGGADKLRLALGQVDAVLVGMPGGEALLDAALAHGPGRPVVIAAWTAGAVEAARRTDAVGADLAAVRPHDVERLAPILFAAGRLAEQRRLAVAALAGTAGPAAAETPAGAGVGEPGRPVLAGSPGLSASAARAPAALAAPSQPAAGAAEPPELAALPELVDVPELAALPELVDVPEIPELYDDDDELDGEPAGLLTAEQFAQAAQRELERARRSGQPLAVAMFVLDIPPPGPPAGLRGILRARAGNALVHALRDTDLATELDSDRFLVVMPYTERAAGAEHARRIIGAVAAGDPVVAAGRKFHPKVIGAVTGTAAGGQPELPPMVRDATQLLEQAQVTGASLAVES